MNIDTTDEITFTLIQDDHRRYVVLKYRDIEVRQRVGLQVWKMPIDERTHTLSGLAKQAKVQLVRECVKKRYPIPGVKNGEDQPEPTLGHVEIPSDESGE